MLPEGLKGRVDDFVVPAREPASPSRVQGVAREALIGYARGFLRTAMESTRFLWRAETGWHAVTLERRTADGGTVAVVTYAAVDLPAGITNREIDVLTLVALGLTNTEISSRLGTSARTVSTQIERLLVKLGQSGRGGLAAIAVDAGLMTLPIPGGVGGLTGLGLVEVERATHEPSGATSMPDVHISLPRRPYLLGSVMSTLGTNTSDGLESMRGTALAVAEVNAAGGVGGRPMEHVVVKADIYDEDSVRAAFQELLEREVDAITASFVSAENPFVLDMVADYGCPFLHTATVEEQVRLVRDNQQRFRSIFQTCPSETHYGPGFVRFLDELHTSGLWAPVGRRVMSIEIDSKSKQISNDLLVERAKASGWEITDTLTVRPSEKDWQRAVDKVAAVQPDALIVAHWDAEDLAVLQTALFRLRLPMLIYYVYGASAPQFSTAAGEAAEGVVWSTVTGRYDDSLGRSFQQRYRAMFGAEAGWSAASAAYDQVKMLASAWSTTGSRDFERVCDHLRATPHRGLNGVYYLADPGQAPLCYPDSTTDPSLGQAQMVYQIQRSRPRALAPAPHGDITAFHTPAWFPAVPAG